MGITNTQMLETQYVSNVNVSSTVLGESKPHCHYSIPVKLNCVSTSFISVFYRNTDSSLTVGEWLSCTAARAWSASKLKLIA
jgi:hypothetical protein